ncbi:HD domain-containing protein [Cribrihabitans neustonicus]|uniref:HD domain-containing protein n=1 Tax=Cribrihabitans neustonicus TaxID=1429085 RepID=UPI003B59CAE6
MSARLDAQFAFLLEADKLRQVERQNLILDCSRAENSAEHSWHLALYALALAPHAAPEVEIGRVIRMLLLHDLVEIDAGDHPIDSASDWQAVAAAEQAAADRLFGLLPPDQGDEMLRLWHEFEASETPDAQFAKRLDHCQPVFQTLCGRAPLPGHIGIVRRNLEGGRAAALEQALPHAYAQAMTLLNGTGKAPCAEFARRMEFLNESDQLKGVLRASKLGGGTRHENSAEHSWHVMMHAWVLAEHAAMPIDLDEVLRMLLLHDLVEIDAGDAPIHSVTDPAVLAALAEREEAAAARLFGLLPKDEGVPLRALWQRFEAAVCPEARFAKSIDRVQPVLLNLMNGGGSWVDYEVTLAQLDTRVGAKVARGAPALWDHVRAQVEPWFAQRGGA